MGKSMKYDSDMYDPIKFAILGAGSRGLDAYGAILRSRPDLGVVVAVAEPRPSVRMRACIEHKVNSSFAFENWQDFVNSPKLADAVIVATQDCDHVGPTIACLELGYDVLLEKPMATSEDGCRAIIRAQKKSGQVLAVCHVLRYSPYFRAIRKIIESGALGQIATVRHFEQVGYWHQAHSYVRGNWRSSQLSSPMIMAKSCHDMDILLYLLRAKCVRLSSFGHLSHFKPENKPAGATERCVTCPLAESECAYSATKQYLTQVLNEKTPGWPVNVITQDLTREGVMLALESGPYGRCVYSCDNDVVDHQVVSFEFDKGISATFTMTAFTSSCERKTELFGSHGELRGDGKEIVVRKFGRGGPEITTVTLSDDETHAGHLGGDLHLMEDFVSAVKKRDPGSIVSGPEESLQSHLMAFAAENSRKNGSVEFIN